MQATVNERTIELVKGDIAALEVDAIVNAANRRLHLGAGVAGAIRRRGGPSIQRECNAIGGCNVGDAVITGGGNLPASHVIHAVGPRYMNPNAPDLLRSATESSLQVAATNELNTIAFPAISTGVFGYPLDKCAPIMLDVVVAYLDDEPSSVQHVIFCLYDDEAFAVFEQELASQLSAL